MKKIVICIIGVALVLFVIISLINIKDGSTNKKGEAEKPKTVDTIPKYEYHLYSNKSEAYKDKFQELSKALTKETVDDKEYAKILSELFVIDLFDLNSKVSNTDIGGADLFYPKTRNDFVKTEEDGMYKYVESNVYGGRKQSLPVVKSAIATIESFNYTGNVTTDPNAYKAVVDITYEKDLEYPTKVYLTLVHSDNKLYVINLK